MHKTFIIIVCIIVFVSKTFAQQSHINNNQQYVYAIGSNVNVRAAPNTTSSIVTKLALGQRVKIDWNYQIDTSIIINGIEGDWKKIKTDDQKEGYVFSPFVALGTIKNGTNPDIMFLVGRTDSRDSMKIVVIKAGVHLQTLVFEARFSGEGGDRFFGFLTLGKAGIPNIDELMVLCLSANCCGCMSNDVTFAWDGKKLHHFFTSFDASEGGGEEVWIDRSYIELPVDTNGEKGVVHYYRESGTNAIDESEVVETPQSDEEVNDAQPIEIRPIIYAEKVHKVMVWDGERLVEKQ